MEIVALLQGLAKAVFELTQENHGFGFVDRDFIRRFTDGFEAYQQNIEGCLLGRNHRK